MVKEQICEAATREEVQRLAKTWLASHPRVSIIHSGYPLRVGERVIESGTAAGYDGTWRIVIAYDETGGSV